MEIVEVLGNNLLLRNAMKWLSWKLAASNDTSVSSSISLFVAWRASL
jgi:hypothetical protein